jgi:hypothetical protein
MSRYVAMPSGVYINEKNSINVISPERKSLFEILHGYNKELNLSNFSKLSILIQLAKILNTFHCLKKRVWAHGSVTSHNVFIVLPPNSEDIDT